jgi:S-methylmethionine-dependent homocysteine/selenocysteine methylase
MPALPEIIGMAQAMGDTGIPYIISFMVRSNGRLIDGTTIHDAIHVVESIVRIKPMTYMANCIHPVNLAMALSKEFNQTELVRAHFTGIQANASPLSPEELDGSCDIITSDPAELAEEMLPLRDQYKLKVFGGCCGTNQHHMEELAKRLSNLR